MDRARWALAFTLLPWSEGRKAELWARIEGGEPPDLAAGEARALDALDPARVAREAADRGARLALPGDGEVDRLLEPLPYPVALWVRGTLPPPGPLVGVVGARGATLRGLARARDWARTLTSRGVGILSGLARGIDGAAHLGALEAGPTWGILGSGLDHPYPPEHRGLMDRMAASGGGVVTPFPPHARPLAWHFPRRNLVLAAWSLGILVVEARHRSGSLVTARLALDQGKELWVVPGDPGEALAEGPNRLLREGAARACLSPEDVLDDLGPLAQGLTKLP